MATASDEVRGQEPEPETVVVEELCRVVALRAHDVGWAAYLLGREMAAQAQARDQPASQAHAAHRRAARGGHRAPLTSQH
jgi:hypothetical protein